MNDKLSNLAKKVQELTIQAHDEYKPLVEDIIANKRTNQREIERLLSQMLGFCSNDKILFLYKALCRYYRDINPMATADYITYYREMWEDIDNKT